MSESLHELEAALADAQREYGLAEDEYTRRALRYADSPTEKRLGKLRDALRTRSVTSYAYSMARSNLKAAQAKEAEHPPLKEGLSTRVTDEDLATLRAEGQLFDVDPQVAADERDNPAAPIVEVEAPRIDAVKMDRWRAAYGAVTDLDQLYRDRDQIAEHYGRVGKRSYNGEQTEGTLRQLAQLRVENSIVLERIMELEQIDAELEEVTAAQPENGGRHRADEQSTPVVTLAPVNGEGRFVPTADVDLPVLEDTREWTAIGTIADGPAKGATAYMGSSPADPFADGYVRNEQGAYEYDGPVGEQPDVPNYLHTEPVAQPWADPNHDIMADLKEALNYADRQPLGDYPDVGTPEWEAVIRSLYGISEDTPIMRHTEWKPKEPNVITVDHNRADRFHGLPVYVREGVAADTVYVLREDGDGGAVLMNPETFEGLKAKMDEVRPPNPDVASAFDLKAKLDRLRNFARDIGALDGVGDPVTKAEADEAPAQKTVDELMIDAGKAAQERWEAQVRNMLPWGQFGYTEQFAKAGDVPSAPADHVTGVTDPESVTVDTERDVQQFGSDTVKLKSQTVTGSFTMTEARPEFFQKVFPNARVVIGSNGKVEITANTMAMAAEHVAASKPTTPEGKLLAEAAQIIGHDRNDQYGNAEDSFGVIAEFWSTWLTARIGAILDRSAPGVNEEIGLTSADVANMLGLMKKARTAVGGHKRDNYTDEIGYTALAERCEAKGAGL